MSRADLYLDRNRDIEFTGGNDVRMITGVDNAEQQVGIEVGASVQPDIGSRLTNQALERIRSVATEILRNDPSVTQITAVRITEVNKQTDTISIDVELNYDTTVPMDIPVEQ